MPEMQAHMLKFAIRPVQSSPEEFAKDQKKDWDRYGTLIREANIKME
jgi:tripartite-type tricarboxylate transporter receptor subunit TctC